MGRQPIPIRQIAIHAGDGEATIDRVLHNRGGVRDTTKARVNRAIIELKEQQALFEFAGRTFTVDLVISHPTDSPQPSGMPSMPPFRRYVPPSSESARTCTNESRPPT
jgi:hypothetical protein